MFYNTFSANGTFIPAKTLGGSIVESGTYSYINHVMLMSNYPPITIKGTESGYEEYETYDFQLLLNGAKVTVSETWKLYQK